MDIEDCNRKERYIPSKPNIKVYKTENAKKQIDTISAELEKQKALSLSLKQQLAAKSKADAQSSYASSQAASAQQTRVAQSATNFDILKRISRLEKEVFGKQING